MTQTLGRVLSAGAVALALLFPGHASAQEAPRGDASGRWSVFLAVSHQGVNDEIASPLRQTGLGPALGLGYRSRGTRSDWGVGVSYGAPSLQAAAGNAGASSEDVHDFALDFAYLRRVAGSDGARFRVFVGAGSKIRLVARIHRYGTRGRETYADFFAPLEVQGMWTYAASRAGMLSGRLAVAAFSVVARDPYTGAKYMPDVEFAGSARVPMLRHVLSYRFGMGSSFDGVVSHELTYLRYPEPRYMVMAAQELRFTLEWKR